MHRASGALSGCVPNIRTMRGPNTFLKTGQSDLAGHPIQEIGPKRFKAVPAKEFGWQPMGADVSRPCRSAAFSCFADDEERVAAEAPFLAGEIEVYASCFGCVRKGKRGRGAGGKVQV